jgi:hypothetical protein
LRKRELRRIIYHTGREGKGEREEDTKKGLEIVVVVIVGGWEG